MHNSFADFAVVHHFALRYFIQFIAARNVFMICQDNIIDVFLSLNSATTARCTGQIISI